MKLHGRISILINREYTSIEIEDDNANVTFVRVVLTPEQMNACLSRQAYVDCELDVMGVEKLGKKHECKSFTFETPEILTSYENRIHNTQKFQQIAQKLLDKEGEGWIAESYFNSQDSFFKDNGKQMARCTIRRWI